MYVFPVGTTEEVRAVKQTAATEEVRPIDESVGARPDAVVFSSTAVVLGKLSQLALRSPDQYRGILTEGARQITEARDEGRAPAPTATALANGFDAAARAGQPSSLAATLSAPSGVAFAKTATDALLQRVDAALGIRAPPYGPWFPR